MATGALVPRSDLTPSDHPMTTSAPANLDRLDESAAAQRDASGRPAPDPACARFALLPKTSSPELDTRIHLCARATMARCQALAAHPDKPFSSTHPSPAAKPRIDLPTLRRRYPGGGHRGADLPAGSGCRTGELHD